MTALTVRETGENFYPFPSSINSGRKRNEEKSIERSSANAPRKDNVGTELPPPISESKIALVLLKEQQRAQRLFLYLQALIFNREVERKTALGAWEAWKTIEATYSHKAQVPDANIGPNGQLLYTWNKGEHHFELEIYPDGAGELFYLNFCNDDTWDSDYSIGNALPEEAKKKLNLFFT